MFDENFVPYVPDSHELGFINPNDNYNQKMDEEDFDKQSMKSIENQFYDDFKFLGEEPADPFLNF